ncbi:hypothetical protein P4S93_09905 [Aneurinibacillus thermoaerophilus]|uniref:YceG-like family protein n=1 Tax=Aneurinibacillus thermoaerophilus TaxID=143495 RepID=A0A1G7YKF6_ANETH|nr:MULTISPECIES: hypothetical protein [Aneurinibacillus]AMA73844.1 hypothetical protein ACH33_13910 [Aneurinibacillus sp. XH2]MED0676679.1 hypothetical protein [Aneurinibacillus thermoaerophilus]MED0679333.1 hypothetical protein [Aneurinibacillus thermoaerophilus]MED0756516.1 hypothetical protein [Aneurinibacillus thermoaerophilus]MED0761085.1 hypothetical protein [Aneurinibacillus thermoaerophilus]
MLKLQVNKNSLRGFAAGVLFSTAVLSFVYYSESPEKAASVQAENVERKDPATQPIKAIEMPKAATSIPKQTQPEPKVYTYRLVIEKGMSPEKVAEILEKAHIIPDRKLLNKYLNDTGLMGLVRYGTYDLNSNMKIPEIAKIITTPKAE